MLKQLKPLPETDLRARIRRVFHHGDRPWQGLIIGISALVIILMIAIGGMLWINSSGSRSAFGWSFLAPTANPNWDPVNNHFQAWPFLYGTLETSLFAILFALPIGLGIAIFLAELCPPWLRTPLTWLVELLAAIPSVVYGLWGIFVFLPQVVAPIGVFLGDTLGQIPGLGILFTGPIPASGASRLAASLILTIMIIPTIAAVSRDVFLAIPGSQREAAKALGATEWETIWQVLIPYGRSGHPGRGHPGPWACLGRDHGRHHGHRQQHPGRKSPCCRPVTPWPASLPMNLPKSVSQLHTDALIEIGLVLFFITLLLNILARFLVWQVARQAPQEARV